VFGGFHSSTTRLNDVWVFDVTSRTWMQPVVPTVASGDAAAAYAAARRKKGAAAGGRRDGGLGGGSGIAGGLGGGGMLGGGMLGDLGSSAGGLGSGAGATGAGLFGDVSPHWDVPIIPDTNPDAPSPRGAHSAVLIGEHLFVFGGYGGAGYQRKDFNDLYRLHIPSMAWQPTDAAAITGPLPEPRSGHIAVPCEHSMVVSGGWSANGQYNDVWVLDTEKLAWSAVPDARFGPFRWNHSGLAIPAVPHWQVFVFGGSGAPSPETGDDAGSAAGGKAPNKDKGSYLDDIHVLDTGSMRWTDLTPTAVSKGRGQFPKHRADATMVYDGINKRVLLFGGWANRWFNDCYALPVASIIGPPYAVLGVEPAIGPITGGQKIVVRGQGFEAGAACNVRFLSGKRFADAAGVCLSATEIEVVTPSYAHFGPGTVDVRMSLRGLPLTITSKPYAFFNVTDASHSFAYGPGVLSGCVAGVPAAFYIQARDTANADRTTGTDEFAVRVVKLQADGTEGKAPELVPGVVVHDEKTGRYLVTYTAPAAGVYKVHVDFMGTYGGKAGPIRASPFTSRHYEEGQPMVHQLPAAATPAAAAGAGAGAAGAAAGAAPLATKENNKFAGPLVWDAARELIDQANATAKATLDGITRDVPGDNLDLLLGVKNCLSNVSAKEAEVQLKVDTARAVLAQLKAEGARKVRCLLVRFAAGCHRSSLMAL
jgi:dynein heavy chain